MPSPYITIAVTHDGRILAGREAEALPGDQAADRRQIQVRWRNAWAAVYNPSGWTLAPVNRVRMSDRKWHCVGSAIERALTPGADCWQAEDGSIIPEPSAPYGDER